MATAEERLSRLEGVYEHLATKADIAELRGEIAGVQTRLSGEIVGVQTGLSGEIASIRTELRTEIANVRVEIAAVENRLLFRLGGLAVALFTVGVAVLGVLIGLSG